jgi:tetratricopeptide (TPR) repeat protein
MAVPLRDDMTQLRATSTFLAFVSLLLLAGCPDKARQESIEFSNRGQKALEKKELEEAEQLFKKSSEKFRDNHLAWWGLGRALKDRSEHAAAADAFENAVRVDGKQPMYHMWLGIELYEKAVMRAKEDLAKKENKKPDQVKPDLATISADTALQHLQEAVKLAPDLWRAHYQIGRILRDQGKDKEAADAFTKAIALNPEREDPYIALTELYMRWDHLDQAVQVASVGAGAVPPGNNRGQVEYSLGLAYFSKRLDDKAIEAFGKALESKKDLRQAKFQRGAAYFRKGDHAAAKKDLEDFGKNGGSLEFEKTQASKMLMDIEAAKLNK